MHPSCAAYPPTAANLAEAAKYTGVQDYDDYDEGLNPYFYDPDDPQRPVGATGPEYPGLMDRAQLPFTAAGLDVPSYVTNGNHDGSCRATRTATPPSRTSRRAASRRWRRRPRAPGLDPTVLLTPSVGLHAGPARPAAAASSTSARSRPIYARTARTTRTATASSTRTRTPTRTSPPATTPGTRPRRRASASSRSTRSPRAASSSSPRTGTSTILSSSGSSASCSSRRPTTS